MSFLLNPFISYGVASNSYELIYDAVISSSTTSVTMSGLTISKSDEYLLITDHVNTLASPTYCALYFNNNTTPTNYYNQYIKASGTSIVTGISNLSQLTSYITNNKNFLYTKIKLLNSGYIICQTDNAGVYPTSLIDSFKFYMTSTFTTSSITSITITSEITNGISVGSRFQLYRIGRV